MALSKDIREKLVKAIKGGMSRRQAAARFDVGPATAVRWAKRVETRAMCAYEMGGDRRSQRIEAHATFILEDIKTRPDTTIMELRDQIRERHGDLSEWDGVAVSGAAQDHAQEEDGPRERAGTRRRRSVARSLVRRPTRSRSDEARVHRRNQHLDEHDAPLRPGAARRALPSPDFRSRHWKTTTFVAGLRVDRIDAPMTIEGALDGEAFLAYVEQVLAPTLSKGETVVMDNVPLHKVAGVGLNAMWRVDARPARRKTQHSRACRTPLGRANRQSNCAGSR